MYAPFGANCDGSDPIWHSSKLFPCRAFASEITPNSQENPTTPFPIFDFHFPLEDHADLFYHDLLLYHHPSADQIPSGIGISNRVHHMEEHLRVTALDDHDHHLQKQTPSQRSSKRGSHTKINTAQGPRDRRMRLSLEVARKFFGLQDILGLDKPSRTIDWLLNQAKYEIKRLERERGRSVSSSSESELVSGLNEVTANASNNRQADAEPSGKHRRPARSRMTVLHPRTKEIRERARARARERTQEKNTRNQKFAQEEYSRQRNEAPNHKSSIFCEETGTKCQNGTSRSPDVMSIDQEQSFQIKEQSGVFSDQCSMTATSKWNLPFLFKALHNPQTAQFSELQFLDKQWETSENHTNTNKFDLLCSSADASKASSIANVKSHGYNEDAVHGWKGICNPLKRG